MGQPRISRRNLLRASAGTAAGTALGGLVGSGADLRPAVARAETLRISQAQQIASVCPYCAVGCDTVINVVDGKVVNIEGDVRSPINQGNLCPKGAAIYQLHVNPNRVLKVLHRAPGAASWEVWDLNRAMDRVAELTKQTRDATFAEKTRDGKTLMATEAIFSLGGATMDNEWNHLQQKLMRGLGVTPIENQARI